MLGFRLRSIAIALLLILGCLTSFERAEASLVLESGPTYFVVQNDAGGTTGSVVMRMDLVVDQYGFFAVHSRILAISAEPGWTWVVKKPGGINKEVEVLFSKDGKRFTFKALYVPGKTITDGGVIK